MKMKCCFRFFKRFPLFWSLPPTPLASCGRLFSFYWAWNPPPLSTPRIILRVSVMDSRRSLLQYIWRDRKKKAQICVSLCVFEFFGFLFFVCFFFGGGVFPAIETWFVSYFWLNGLEFSSLRLGLLLLCACMCVCGWGRAALLSEMCASRPSLFQPSF